MRKPSKEEIQAAYKKLRKDGTNVDNWSFLRGIEFLEEFQKPSYFMGKNNHLGFELDTKMIYTALFAAKDVDEFDAIKHSMEFTDVGLLNNTMIIAFSIDNRQGLFIDNTITIDNLGRVYVNLDDTPWESGGVQGEMEEIIMKCVAKQKYK